MDGAQEPSITRPVTLDDLGSLWLREAIISGLVMVVDAPPASVRRNRLSLRDDAIREAGRIAAASGHASALKIQNDLDRYLVTADWRANQTVGLLPEGTHPWRQQLHRIAILNDGKPLGWRQILNIFAGDRGR